MEDKEISSQLSSFMGKLLRDRFGKGPESIHISYDSRSITMHMRNFIGPVEKLLLTQQKEEAFRDTRKLVMDSLIPDLNEFIKTTIRKEVEEFYYDWDLEHHSGILVGLFYHDVSEEDDVYEGKEAIHERVGHTTQICEKIPDRIHSYWTNSRTLVIIRYGLLIKIEKQMLDLGYEGTLRISKRVLEKHHFAHDVDMKQILGRTVEGLFLDWKFEKDKSVLVYIFKN
ncbi:Na-translocating system protein MpsC family protein [Paenibacillus nasutitermitis]|uniref:Na+-translocating membrane potential-generating system MpsC domain-containing protein n=1 Tax=Paenibacillus nasutitermitis TaxID=1652958 RepID=A0A916Z5K4_9BACL|nr:Na-translocating system protein MpsC family protein [Paenibacillus nasutitermitis]GGD77131.1 hypothetical protein GCM10010911_38940 [Paenibacillus nasutitermitis]